LQRRFHVRRGMSILSGWWCNHALCCRQWITDRGSSEISQICCALACWRLRRLTQLAASTAFSENNEIESFGRQAFRSLSQTTRMRDGETDRRTYSDTQRRTRRRYQRKQTVPRRQLSMHVMLDERHCTSSTTSVVISRSILHAARALTARKDLRFADVAMNQGRSHALNCTD